MKKYYLILDQGTTSSRSILYDDKFNLIDKVSILLTQSYPKSRWVEHDPIEIWNAQRSTMQQVLVKNNVKIDEIISIGISNQRETIVAWDKTTGMPVYNAIVWQDARTAEYCENLSVPIKQLIKQKTGLLVSPYFSASKIKWILDNVPKAQKVLAQNNLLVGTIDSWLLFKLTRNKVHKTDYTNASRTMLFNINTLTWDEELLALFNIPKTVLASVHASSDNFAEMDNSIIDSQAKSTTPILAMAGDQQASLFGQQCFYMGNAKATFGTGCFILMNTGEQRIDSKHHLLTSLACTSANQKVQYILEGSVFNAGTVIQWLSNDLRILYNPEEANWYSDLAITNDQDDLYFVPAFTGLGAPYWDPNARGLIIGIERNTRREHIIKAAIEGIGFQVKDVIDSMLSESDKLHLNSLKVDGGLSKLDFLNKFLANILETNILRNNNYEASSLGIAYLCALAANNFELQALPTNQTTIFVSDQDQKKVEKKYLGWQVAVQKSLDWKK